MSHMVVFVDGEEQTTIVIPGDLPRSRRWEVIHDGIECVYVKLGLEACRRARTVRIDTYTDDGRQLVSEERHYDPDSSKRLEE